MRRLSSKVPSSYIRSLLQSTKKAASDEPLGDITIEQTPYFDVTDDEDFASLVTLMLEDEEIDYETIGYR